MEAVFEARSSEEQSRSPTSSRPAAFPIWPVDRTGCSGGEAEGGASPGRLHAARGGRRRFPVAVGAATANQAGLGSRGGGSRRGTLSANLGRRDRGLAEAMWDTRCAIHLRASA